MKIRLQGFQFETGKGISEADFYKRLLECNDGDFDFTSKKRLFYFSDTGNKEYYLGLFITIKDHKKFLQLNSSLKKIIVTEVAKDTDLMDFNFFIINKKTLMGMYQSYHPSCSINQFCIFCRKRYEILREEHITTEMKPYLNEPDKKRKKILAEIHKKYKGSLIWRLLVRKESLGALMKNLQSLSSFEFDTFDLTVQERQFTPAADYATKVHKKILFDRKAPLTKIAKNISDFVNQSGITDGMVKGYDENGELRVVKIVENPDVLGEYDFDTVLTKQKDFNLEDLSKNWMIKEMLSKAKQHTAHFETKSNEAA